MNIHEVELLRAPVILDYERDVYRQTGEQFSHIIVKSRRLAPCIEAKSKRKNCLGTILEGSEIGFSIGISFHCIKVESSIF